VPHPHATQTMHAKPHKPVQSTAPPRAGAPNYWYCIKWAVPLHRYIRTGRQSDCSAIDYSGVRKQAIMTPSFQ